MALEALSLDARDVNERLSSMASYIDGGQVKGTKRHLVVNDINYIMACT